MMKKLFHASVWIVFGVFVLMGFSGCSFFESDNSSIPTGPVSISSGSSGNIANFYASRGHGNSLGIYKGEDVFVVNVPAGHYLLTYKTNWGIFHLVFSALEISLLHVGLVSGTEVEEITILEGDIDLDDLEGADVFGNILLVSWPGQKNPRPWNNVFLAKPGAIPIFLVQAGIIVQSPLIIVLPYIVVFPPPDPIYVSPIYVNNVIGVDASGCGTTSAPCQTINYGLLSARRYGSSSLVVEKTGFDYDVTSSILINTPDNLTILSEGVVVNMTGVGLIFNASGNITFKNFTINSDFDPALNIIGSGNVKLIDNQVDTAGGRHLLHDASGNTYLEGNIFTGAAGISIECTGSGNLGSDGTNTTDGTIVGCGALTGPGTF